MLVRHIRLTLFVLLVGSLGLAACEPYMSMTDSIPAQTRQAALLMSEGPNYVGMVNVGTLFTQLEDWAGKSLADSLQHTDDPYVRQFLETTGFDLGRDLESAYGSFEDDGRLSVVLFANLSAERVDRYLEQAPRGAGRMTTYKDVPLYRLAIGVDASDTLSVAFVEKGVMAVAAERAQVVTMIDRHRGDERALRDNQSYMALMKRLSRESTAWLAGRDVLETALQESPPPSDSTAPSASPDEAPEVSQAGMQRALTQWSDRVLGLSEVSDLEGRAGDRVDALRNRVREQALSITLTDAGLDGQVYLTMRDEASASSVVDVAQGLVALSKLSGDDLDERHRKLLEAVDVERHGTIVRIRFSLDQEQVRRGLRAEAAGQAVRRMTASIHRSPASTRRTPQITRTWAL